jgi:hypothetical protein
LSQAFEAGGDVYGVTKNIAVLDHHIAHVDSDTKIDAPVEWNLGIPLGHPDLYLGRTTQRVDDAAELDQQAVAGGLDDAAVMLGDLGIDQVAPMRL